MGDADNDMCLCVDWKVLQTLRCHAGGELKAIRGESWWCFCFCFSQCVVCWSMGGGVDVVDLSWSVDSARLASCSLAHELFVWNIASNDPRQCLFLFMYVCVCCSYVCCCID